MDFYILIVCVSLNILLGTIVLIRNYKSATNILFCLLTCDIAGWAIANYYSIHLIGTIPDIFWMRLVMALAVPQAVLFFLLIHTFPELRIRLNKILLVLLLILSGIVIVISFTPYLFSGVQYVHTSKTPVVGPGMLLFIPVAIGSLLAGTIVLFRKYVRSIGIQKVQLRLILIGLFSMFILIVLLNFVLVVFFGISYFVSLGPLYSFPFIGAVAYAIMRHKFLDIDFIIARSVSYIIIVLTLAGLYAILAFFAGTYIFSFNLEPNQQILLIIFTIAIAVTFQSIQKFFEKLTDSVLFKGRYDPNELLGILNHIMASTLKPEELTHGILEELIKHLRVKKAMFILLKEDLITDVFHAGLDNVPTFDENEIKVISTTRDIVVFDLLEEGHLKDIVRKLDLAVISHLRTEGEQVGLLALGAKESGEIFSGQDLSFLEIFTPEVAVAIQNTMAYEEIRRFNVTLQEEVDKATNELKTANVQLQELDRLKDEFVSLASHELRSPMTAIRGSLSTILEGFAGDISPTAKEFLNAAYNENERLLRLISNLLNISRIEGGRFTFNITKVNMDQIITDVVSNLERAAKEKNLYLKYEHDGPLPIIDADEDKVKEVLINLIGNAVKFTHVGGVIIKAEVKDNQVITSITDTGSGIAKEDQDLLFKKFSQVRGDYAKQAGGTGLGLYICKIIVEGLGGKIWLDSTIWKGSTFYFSLPMSRQSAV